MFEYVYFIGSGSGRPLRDRKLPAFLLGLRDKQTLLLECGSVLNTDDPLVPFNVAQLDIVIITALNIELFAGLPALLHSMRLMNRTKALKFVAPESLHNVIRQILVFDNLDMDYEIEYLSIEREASEIELRNARLFVRAPASSPNRYQVYLTTEGDAHKSTLFYTGKTTGIADPELLVGDTFIIHNTTYSYEDANLTTKTGLPSYKDALEMIHEVDPALMFITHYSPRYSNPIEEIDKGRIQPANVIKTYDGYRYDFAFFQK